jgi:hypothetical protein
VLIEMSDAIQFHSRVNEVGVLNVQINLGREEANKEVVVTIEPASVSVALEAELPWSIFVERTYGSCAGQGLERPEQGNLEVREPIA